MVSCHFQTQKYLDNKVNKRQLRGNGKTVYRKPTFSYVYTRFDSFLPTDYKFGMIYTLAYHCFKICSDWTRFDEELNFLKHVFLKNGYPLPFIDKCFKMAINKLVIKRPHVKQLRRRSKSSHYHTQEMFPYKQKLN